MNKFYIFPGNNSYLVKEALLRRGNWQEASDDPNPFADCQFIWKPTNLSISEYLKLDSIIKSHPKNSPQVFNHFENIRGICTKTGLVRSLKKYYQTNYDSMQVNYNVFDTTPTSFLITAGVDDTEYAGFAARYREIVKQNFNKEAVPQKHAEGNIWLVKPANLNQGRGIEVYKNLKDINNFLSTKPYNSLWVVQKYVEKPLLYKQRKFDIRIWVVITAKNEIFLYKNAYIRTSSDNYDLQDTSKNYVHLTNNCLQKHGENYGKHEDGNTLAFDALDEYLKEVYPEYNVKIASHVVPRIRDLIIDTFLCTRKTINPQYRKNVFELFGFDFLIDEDLRTWLIEVNTNPYLGIPNKYIAKILPEMLDDMLEIVADPHFPPATNPRDASRPNYYELIYCESSSSHHHGSLNVRSPFTKNVYPVQALLPPDVSKKLLGSGKNHESIQSYYHSSSLAKNDTDGNNDQDEEGEGTEGKDPSSNAMREKAKDQNINNIEWIYKRLCDMVTSPYEFNADFIATQITRIFSSLRNWELLSDREVNLACKSLQVAAQSPAGYLLTQQQNVIMISKLLRSNNLKPETKFGLIDTINTLSKDINLKKKLICNYLVHNLVTICLSSCDEKEVEGHHKGFLTAVLKCLINLGGVFNRKLYIPGETREANKLRIFFIAQGGIAALWLISQRSLIEEMKEYCSKNFLNYLEVSDWERQLQIFEILAVMPKIQHNLDSQREKIKAETEGSLNNIQEKPNKGDVTGRTETEAIFYRTGEINAIEKAFMEKSATGKIEPTDKGVEKIINFPKSLLQMVSLEDLKQEFSEYVNNFRQSWQKREAEEKEKKQILESEKVKRVESRKKELEEQRKHAMEGFEKRVKENLKKQQADLEKKQQEIEGMKQRNLEERKRNIEILMNRKADREKKLIKLQAHRQEAKRNKALLLNKENRDKSASRRSQGSRSRTPDRSPDSVQKIQKNSLGFKKVDNFSKSDTIRNASKEIGYSGQTNGMSTEVKIEDLKRQFSRSSNSRKSSPNSGAEFGEKYFMASRPLGDSQKISHTDAHQTSNSNIVKESQSMNDSITVKGSTKDNLPPNIKLPKIQKSGRILINQKVAQSPYLRNLVEPSSAELKPKKEPKIRKEIDISPYLGSNLNNLISKVKLQG